MSDLKKVFTEPFINKMLANTHLKIYDFSATEKQVKRKTQFKNDFIKIYKQKVLDFESKEPGH